MRHGTRYKWAGCLAPVGTGLCLKATSPTWGKCVLKIAGVEFAGTKEVRDGEIGIYRNVLPHSLYGISGPSQTGPLLPPAPATLEQAGSLLENACRRQKGLAPSARWPDCSLFCTWATGPRRCSNTCGGEAYGPFLRTHLEKLRGPSPP